MQGWVDPVGLLHTEMVYHNTRPKMVTHPGTNRARRVLTLFMQWTPLTTMPRRQPIMKMTQVLTSALASSMGRILSLLQKENGLNEHQNRREIVHGRP